MTIEFLLLFGLIVHFLADFALQTHEQAMGKSVGSAWNNMSLFYHVAVYSLVWFIAMLPILGLDNAFIFAVITFVCHWITDALTSRMGKPYWAKQDLHNGFVIVGADQILHYIQLYLTFKLLIQ